MNSVAVILGILFVSFGLGGAFDGSRNTRKDPDYHPMTVWLVPVSLGAIFILNGLFT